MKSTAIGIYTSHEHVISAAKTLKENGFTDKQISIIWQREEVEKERQEAERKITVTTASEVGAGLSIGGVLGVLTGIGVFAIPGLGFLYGAGALVGAVAGIDFGVIAGSIIGALSIPGIHAHHQKKYDAYLKAGDYILFVQGTNEEMEKAKSILISHGQSSEIELHE